MRAVLTVIGKDRYGIAAEVCNMAADNNMNIVEINSAKLSDYFTMILIVEIDNIEKPFDELVKEFEKAGKETGLQISLQHEDIFNTMHRLNRKGSI